MNNIIIQNFENLITFININKPKNFSFKINSFKKVIQIISNLDYDISLDNLKKNNLFSDKINNRIKEILINGSLSELNDNTLSNNNNNNNINSINHIKKLITITGIGPSKAKQLIDKNIYFDNLINAKHDSNLLTDLTHHQKIGLLYYNDLQKKIPRNIIDNINLYLNKLLPDLNYIICGSYRRKKDFSGDIDILIENNNNYNLKDIINILHKKKFLIAHLTSNVKTKYMGICKLDSFKQYMRIDIRLIDTNSFPYATLYFTGSKNTNTFMRQQAIKLGFKLNEYALFDRFNNPIYLSSEQQIFECLNLNYIEPENR